MIAGVHSTVWILASNAALISRAFWNSSSSDQLGYSAASRSQMALCSRAKSVSSRPRPTHQPGTWPSWSSRGGGSSSPPRLATIAQLAAGAGAHAGLELLVGGIDLRCVPPVRLEVDVRGRCAAVVRRPGGIGDRARDEHRVLRKVVARRQRQLPRDC